LHVKKTLIGVVRDDEKYLWKIGGRAVCFPFSRR